MPNELLIAILAGLGGMLGWGLADFFAKKTIDEIGDIVSLVWAHIFGTLVLVAIGLYQLIAGQQVFSIPSDAQTWWLLAGFGALQGIVYLLVYKGFAKGQLAVLSPIFASFSGLVAIISIVVFGEAVSGSIVLTLVVIFAGVILLSTDFNKLHLKGFSLTHAPGSKEVLLATVFAAVWTLSWDKFIGGKDWVSYALFMYIFMTLTLFLIAKAQKVKLSFTKPAVWKFLVFIGVFEVIAYLAISLGYSATSLTSIVALLSGAFSLPAIILAYVFLKERVSKFQAFGVFLVLLGIVFLSLL